MWVFSFVLSSIYCLSSLPVIHRSSAAGEDTLIGIKGRDCIIMYADSSIGSSISLTSTNVDKIRVLIDPFPTLPYPSNIQKFNRQQAIVAAVAGDSADADRLLGLLAAHALMVEFDSGLGCDIQYLLQRERPILEKYPRYLDSPAGLDAESLSYLVRGEIATYLRSPNRYQVCLLIAGMVRCVRHSPKENIIAYKSEISSKTSKSFAENIQDQVGNAVHLANLVGNENQPLVWDTRLQASSNDEVEDDQESLFLTPKLFWLDEYGSRSS